MRVFLVDDEPEFAAEVIGFFRDLREAELVGVAPSAELAERYIARLDPDLLLLSLPLGTPDGSEAVRNLAWSHDVPVLVLALHVTEGYRTAVLRAGARDLVAKGDLVTNLPAVIRSLFGQSGVRSAPHAPPPAANGSVEPTDGAPPRRLGDGDDARQGGKHP